MENLSDFYSYRLIGKLTVFFNFRSSSSVNRSWNLPLPSLGFLLCSQGKLTGLSLSIFRYSSSSSDPVYTNHGRFIIFRF
jgi:hypothetical protein